MRLTARGVPNCGHAGKSPNMALTLILLLFLIAAIIFAIDFLLGFAPGDYARWRAQSLAWALMAVAFLLWHGGK